MPKIVYAGTREESFFPELWSAQAKETAARLGYEIAIPGFTRFEGTRERWREFLAGAEGIVTTWFSPRIDAGILRVAPKLRIVGHAAGSLAGYVSPELFEAGVKVTSANTDMAHAVAEWCLMGALMGRRNVAAYSEFGTAGRLNFPGRSACGSVRNAVVGIWGFGMVAEHLVRMLEPLDRPAGKGNDVPGVLQKGAAGHRHADCAGVAAEQFDVQLLFQRLDLLGDGGLSDMQLFGGPRKAQSFRNGQKTGELKGIHPLPLSIN